MVHVLAATTLSSAILASIVSAENFFYAAEAPDYNNKVVANLLANVSSIRADGEAYAVFDWDNTCMFGDIPYSSVLYQVEHLNFRFKPEDFETLFALGYNSSSSDNCLVNGTHSVLGQDINGADVTIATILSETAKDYKVLFDAYIGPTYNLTEGGIASSLNGIKESYEFANFQAKIAFLIFGLQPINGGNGHSNCAMTISTTTLPQLLVGMTEDEIKALIRSSIRWNLAEALETQTYTSTGDLEVEGSYSKGIRFFNGQESVMRALRATGANVYIISAAPQLFAAEAANLFGLGNMVSNDNVFGVRFKTDEEGLFTGKLVDNYPITWGPGKATIISTILESNHNGAAPIFASGDSTGDCEMLNTVRDGVIDTNNRLSSSSSCINEFYEKACKYFGTTEPNTKNTYLLQGQDKTIGTWITSGFSTKDGISYESAVDVGCAQYRFLS